MDTSWQSKIVDLEAAKWSLTDIATAIGLSVQAASDIKQGRTKQPRGHAAVLLMELHRKHVGKKPAAKIRANRSR